jgi:hypothetical protein
MPRPDAPSAQAIVDMQRYERAMQALHNAVSYEIEMGINSKDKTMKSLRVGVNSTLVDFTALAQLLIKKDIITEDEYLASLASAAEEEVKRYEVRLGKKFF